MLSEKQIRFLDRYFKPVSNKVPNSGSMILLNREVERETEKAVCVYIRHELKWLPKSMIFVSADGRIAIPRWLIRSEQEAALDPYKPKPRNNQRTRRENAVRKSAIHASTDIDALNRRLLRLEAEHLEIILERKGLDFEDDSEDLE